MKAELMYRLLPNAAWNLEEWKAITSWAGWVIFLIVEVPMLLLVLATIFGRPRKLKVSIIFIATLLVLLAIFVVAAWILSLITSIFVP